MKKSNHREKVLSLADKMIQMASNEKFFQFDAMKEKVHELFEHASLDADPITDEKQNALKALMIELHKIEKSKDLINRKNFIQALNQIKFAYQNISS